MKLSDKKCPCGLRTWAVSTLDKGKPRLGYTCPACGPVETPAKIAKDRKSEPCPAMRGNAR